MSSYYILNELGLAVWYGQFMSNFIDNEQNGVKINNPSKILNLSIKIPKILYHTEKTYDPFKSQIDVKIGGK